MKIRPILFSTTMVKAILEGRKTQTSRILKVKGCKPFLPDHSWSPEYIKKWNKDYHPYGQPGDILYVRETWRPIGWSFEGDGFTIQYADGKENCVQLFADDTDKESDFSLKLCDLMQERCEPEVNEEEEYFSWTTAQIEEHMPWRPSIYLPKSAARIWLQIEDIRVEQLQDISEDDAIAEGIEKGPNGYLNYQEGGFHNQLPKNSFRTLWESINGPDSWNANPWVWAITFKVLSTTGRPESLGTPSGAGAIEARKEAAS